MRASRRATFIYWFFVVFLQNEWIGWDFLRHYYIRFPERSPRFSELRKFSFVEITIYRVDHAGMATGLTVLNRSKRLGQSNTLFKLLMSDDLMESFFLVDGGFEAGGILCNENFVKKRGCIAL